MIILHSLYPVQIDPLRKYWLIRAESGEYYDEFIEGNFVAIGWDELNEFSREQMYNDEFMVEQINTIYTEDIVKQPWRVYTQVRKFIHEVSNGDVVLVPSATHVMFGIIQGDIYLADIENNGTNGCPFKKRRRVSWLKSVRRPKLDPYLYKLLHSQFTISSAVDYAPYIDRTLHSYFIKGDKAHLVLQVERQDQVFLRDINRLIEGSLSLVDIFNELTDSRYDSNNIEGKINVQSPGPVEFIAGAAVILIIGTLIHHTVGGRIKSDIKGLEFDKETEAFFSKFAQIKEKSNDPKIESKLEEYRQTLDKLEVRMPEELTESVLTGNEVEETK